MEKCHLSERAAMFGAVRRTTLTQADDGRYRFQGLAQTTDPMESEEALPRLFAMSEGFRRAFRSKPSALGNAL